MSNASDLLELSLAGAPHRVGPIGFLFDGADHTLVCTSGSVNACGERVSAYVGVVLGYCTGNTVDSFILKQEDSQAMLSWFGRQAHLEEDPKLRDEKIW